ncbi:MAG: tetratricopeptide repeat protein [Imperialibacter sp.]|uniref:tetratricopeptide repeat protein n=1 Tax=Imperialibacter sp. TaxID=2038411 RepID=UPI0032EDC801
MNHKILLTLLALNAASVSKAQSTYHEIEGIWIRVKAENVDSNYHFNPYDPSLRFFNSFQFTSEGKLRISHTPFDSGQEVDYLIKNQILHYNNQKLKLISLTDSLLVLEEDFASNNLETQPKRFFYYNQTFLNKDRTFLTTLEIENEPLILTPVNIQSHAGFSSFSLLTMTYPKTEESYSPMPKFNFKNLSLERYLQENIGISASKKKENKTRVSFKIDETGKLSDLKALNDNDERLNKAILAALKTTHNKWEPAHLGVQKVSCLMIFDIKLISPPSYADNDPARKHYNDGNRHFEAGDLNKAVEMYTTALDLNPRIIDAYYNRAAAFYQLNKKEDSCKDWLEVYKTGSLSTYEYLVEFCGLSK